MYNKSNSSYSNEINSPEWISIKVFMCISISAEAILSGLLIDLLRRHNLVSPGVLRVLGSFATGLVLAGGLVDVLPDALSVYARHKRDNFQLPLLIIASIIALLLLLDKSIAMLIQVRKRSKPIDDDGSRDKLISEEGHAHLDTSILSERWYVSLIVLTGLSMHSLFEGIGMGAARNKELLLSIYFVIILHKGFVAASLAIVILHNTRVSRVRFYFLMLVFSSMSALGGIVGVILGRLENRVWMVDVAFNCIAAGTFVYIALRELVPQFLEQKENSFCADLCKVFMFVAGFIFLVSVILSISLYEE